ncbi:MAG TPA: hypothetical protein VFL85_04665 [Candidatus Saccharimonadales bacterium]|nr:hypothetical protein [Candidatus Saccharimonadales bacterium]
MKNSPLLEEGAANILESSAYSEVYPETADIDSSLSEVRHQQEDFLTELFSYPAEIPIRELLGRQYPRISATLAEVHDRLKEIHPDLPMDSLNSMYYQEVATTSFRSAILSRPQRDELDRLQSDYAKTVWSLAGELNAAQQGQTIAEGVLDTPAYEQQSHEQGGQACFNACFRMVVNSVSDMDLREVTVADALKNSGYQHVAHDEVFLRALLDDRFAAIAHKDLTVRSGIGMELASIDTIARKVKGQNPDRGVYCITSLASETAGKGHDYRDTGLVWHTAMLLAAGESKVMIHDPSCKVGAPFRTLDREDFLRRWGATFNRCQLVITEPRQ